MAQWIGCWPANQKVTGSIPSQGTCLGCRPGTQLGVCKRQPISVSLPLFLPPFPLSKNKYNLKQLFKEKKYSWKVYVSFGPLCTHMYGLFMASRNKATSSQSSSRKWWQREERWVWFVQKDFTLWWVAVSNMIAIILYVCVKHYGLQSALLACIIEGCEVSFH